MGLPQSLLVRHYFVSVCMCVKCVLVCVLKISYDQFYPFTFCTHFQLTNAHHRHMHSYFHAVSESVTSCVQTYPETCGRDACTIGELCGHWDTHWCH